MATSIKGLLQSITGGETGIYTGKVVAVKPLAVKLQDDSNMKIGEALLLVPEHLKKRSVSVKTADGTLSGTIDESLKKGDMVYLLSIDRGTRYLIVGRC